MSKGQLEEIEKNLDPLGYGMGGHLISVNDIHWLVKYAKEQAERVQELVKAHELKDLEHQGLVRQIKEKDEQNKRYREALFELRELLHGRVDYILRDELCQIIDTVLEDES